MHDYTSPTLVIEAFAYPADDPEGYSLNEPSDISWAAIRIDEPLLARLRALADELGGQDGSTTVTGSPTMVGSETALAYVEPGHDGQCELKFKIQNDLATFDYTIRSGEFYIFTPEIPLNKLREVLELTPDAYRRKAESLEPDFNPAEWVFDIDARTGCRWIYFSGSNDVDSLRARTEAGIEASGGKGAFTMHHIPSPEFRATIDAMFMRCGGAHGPSVR